MMITHDLPPGMHGSFPDPSLSHLPSDQIEQVRALRSEVVARYRPHILEGPGPIRIMARLVAELEQLCREHAISDEVIQASIVNRTIGDVDLRRVTECEGEAGGPGDFRLLADELGIALPGEQLPGYTASGETYLWLREQMQVLERTLLKQRIDVRMYDIFGIGNPLLRGWLASMMQQQWGLPFTKEQIHLGIGAMDCVDKSLRSLRFVLMEQTGTNPAILFPEPGFNVPEWQARSYGYRMQHYKTDASRAFKLPAAQLEEILQNTPDIGVIYLTVTNNPTTFAYNAQELDELFAAIRPYWEQGRHIYILADLAYVGTGDPADDAARMATFATPDVMRHTIFVNSFSKTLSLTGDRFGYVAIGDPKLAPALGPGWTNSTAALPGEWQLRYMAVVRLLQERPWLIAKLRALYRLRRRRFENQLHHINMEQPLFQHIYEGDDATVYTWCQLAHGEDAFSLFEKTGIAGVPGSGFGYTDDFIRFSIGVIPVPEW
ncbi:MAG TPA: pyridoxal phosphate-dependent aminotransferase [Ktedonobacteraceae bacterium]|nr:pyridoxal phosphate-dependent aminotransferase [Ktedonobacteraceae bacterium]